MKTHANCIRFCPLLLKLKERNDEDPPALIDLPYRMVFAVATIDHVLIYTTQSIYPLSIVKNLHYDSINDLAWMNNQMLAIGSSDGFCSFIDFAEDFIGERLPLDSEQMPEYLKDHYKDLSAVSFQRNIEIAAQNKTTGFAKISFKSKKVEQPQPEPTPAQPVPDQQRQ